jgi:hypothetical protein
MARTRQTQRIPKRDEYPLGQQWIRMRRGAPQNHWDVTVSTVSTASNTKLKRVLLLLCAVELAAFLLLSFYNFIPSETLPLAIGAAAGLLLATAGCIFSKMHMNRRITIDILDAVKSKYIDDDDFRMLLTKHPSCVGCRDE